MSSPRYPNRRPAKNLIPLAPEGMKWCSRCKDFRPLIDHTRTSTYCRSCTKIMAQARRNKLIDKLGRGYARTRRNRIKESGKRYTWLEWEVVKAQYQNMCANCGSDDITVDYVIPVSKGGSGGIENVQPLCRNCNRLKGMQTIDYRTKRIVKKAVKSSEDYIIEYIEKIDRNIGDKS